MKPAPKRHRVSDHHAVSDAASLQRRQGAILETVFAPEADGLAAWFLRAAPGTRTPIPAPVQSGGQYVLVAAGTLLHDGMPLPKLSCLYASHEAEPLVLQAAADGLEVLILQFPVTAALFPKAPGSDHGRQ